jgi:hypothetical protein
MTIEGCVHVPPDSEERICAACKEMLRREREVGLQIIPVERTPEKGRRMPPLPMPADIGEIIRDRTPKKPTVH